MELSIVLGIGFHHGGSAGTTALAPSATWNGTAGTGYGGIYEAVPSDPSRTTAQPVAQLLITPETTFADDLTLIVEARANGGINYVDFYCEGNRQRVTTPGFYTYLDANGATKNIYGYRCVIDGDAARAVSGTGEIRVYAKAVPTDGTMQERVIGPFQFFPRVAGVGATGVFDKEIFVDKTGGDTAGVRYSTLVGALNWCQANVATAKFPVITIESTGEHAFATAVTTETGARASWTVIRALTTATIGDGSALRNVAGHQYDGLAFRGSGLNVDLVKISPNMAGFRLRTTSNKRIWFDGCEITMGTNNTLLGSGSGSASLYDGVTSSGGWVSQQAGQPFFAYATDCNMHDIAGYGPSQFTLVRGCTIARIGGSALENCTGAVVWNDISEIGGPLAGLRTYLDAINITIDTGTNPNAQIEITNNVGSSSRSLRIYPDNVTPTPDVTVALTGVMSTSPTVPNATRVSAVVTAIDALSYATAVEVVQPRAAIFLTLQSQGNASPLTRQNIGASMTLDTWVDVHADAFVWHSLAFENTITAFNNCNRLVEAALIGINSSTISVKDFYMGQITSRDTSVAEGYSISAGYINADAASHIVFEGISQVGGSQTFGVAFSPDAYCKFANSHLDDLSWTARVNRGAWAGSTSYSVGNYFTYGGSTYGVITSHTSDSGTPPPNANTYTFGVGSLSLPVLNITRLSMLYSASLSLPSGADSNSVEQANGVTAANLFANVPSDWTPSPLLLLGGQYAGARNLTTWNVP